MFIFTEFEFHFATRSARDLLTHIRRKPKFAKKLKSLKIAALSKNHFLNEFFFFFVLFSNILFYLQNFIIMRFAGNNWILRWRPKPNPTSSSFLFTTNQNNTWFNAKCIFDPQNFSVDKLIS